jgi:hypothetical protein
MYGKQEQVIDFSQPVNSEEAFPAWSLLDGVVRQWVALSGHEKDQENYAKLRQKYQD